MDEARYNEIRAIRDRMAGGLDAYRAITPNVTIDSGIGGEETLAYLREQTVYDEDLKALKAFSNGVKGSYKGIINFLQMLRDENIRQHKEQDPNYKVNDEAVAILDNAADVQMYDVRSKTKLGQFGLDFMQGAGQFAVQGLVGALSGGTASAAFMGANIAGSQYADLVADGVDSRRAMKASLTNAALQAPLEYIGFKKMFKAMPVNAMWQAKAREVFERAFTESVTEAVQKFPEQFSNIYAKNEGLDAQGIARKWDENALQNLKDAGYEGMVAFLLGGAGGGLAVNISTKFQKEMRAEVHKTQQEQTEKRIEQIRAKGVNPKYAATTINNNIDDTVHIGGETLNQYAQEHNIQKVAEGLGVTEKTIVEAAESGDTVEVKRGNFEAYSASDGAFYQTVKDDVAYDTDGYTTNKAKAEAEAKIKPELSKPAQEALDEEIKKIRTSAEQALVPKAQIDYHLPLLTSFAMQLNPENPAQVFKDYALRITRDGIMGDGFNQAAAMKKQTFKNIKEFDEKIKNDTGKISKLGYWIGLQSDVELVLPASNYIHIQNGSHPLNFEQWQSFVDSLDIVENAESYTIDDGGVGSFGGKRVGLKIKTPLGKAGAILEFMPNGKVFIVTVAYNNDGALDNWLKNKKGSQTFAIANESQQGILGSSFIKIIQEKLGIVKDGYNQSAYNGIPYTFNYEQIINSQEFKEWFGDWTIISDAIPNAFQDFNTKAYEIAKEKLREFSDNEIVNKITGIPATVSKRGRNKTISAQAMRLSQENGYSANEHLLAVANIDKLYRNAELFNIRDDKYEDIPSIKEFVAPLILGKNKTAIVHLTVKETNNAGHKIYTVQLLELKRPAGYLPRSADKRSSATAGSVELNITRLAEKFNGIYNKVDENGKPLMSEVQKFYEQKGGSQNQSYYQSAYHGTPHNFDKFDLGAIGTGEGAQVHGWGLYFAKDRKVAEGYRDMLVNADESDGPFQVKIGNALIYIINPLYDPNIFINGKEVAEGSPEFNAMLEVLDLADFAGRRAKGKISTITGKIRSRMKFADAEYADELRLTVEAIERLAGGNDDYIAMIEDGAGSLFEVDVPENDVLLDENKTFTQQSSKVQKSLKDMLLDEMFEKYLEDEETLNEFAEQEVEDWKQGFTGGDVYRRIADLLGSDENASMLLNKYGIKGITYDGKDDGRCFVVFDDKAISVIEKYNQQHGTPKGSFNPNTNIINLFKQADASTVIHETGHYFLEVMSDMYQRGMLDERRTADFEALINYGGMTVEEWFNADTKGREKCHEHIAEAFETYLMEGKAPSKKLRSAFEHFAKWLKAVYKSFARTENALELTDDVREVFDRMLAGDEAIEEQQRINDYFAKLPKAIADNLSDKQKSYVLGLIERARDKAETLFVRESLKNFSAERKEAIKNLAEKVTPDVEAELRNNPLYAASFDIEEYLGKYNNAKVYARQYLNADGKIYTDWRTELDAVNAEIGLRLNPIIERLKEGMGNGVTIMAVDEYGHGVDDRIETPHRYIRISNNEEWYRDWYAQYKRVPNKAELEQLAYEVYTGQSYALWEYASVFDEFAEEIAKDKAEIDELIARREELLEMKEAVAEFKHLGLNAEKRQLLEAIAEAYGFASGTDLAEQVVKQPTFKQAVKMRVADVVAMEYPDIKTDKALREKAAKEAYYNNESALLVATECELINDVVQQFQENEANKLLRKAEADAKKETTAQPKRSKEEILATATARKQQAIALAEADFAEMDLRRACSTEHFIARERNAAVKAAQAVAKKDYNRAIGYKNQQLYYHSCVQLSKNVRKRRGQLTKYVKKQSKAKRETWYNEDYFNQAGALMARMGITHKQYDPALNDKSLIQFISEKFQLHGQNIAIAPWIIDGNIDIKNANNLTLRQYEDVVNALKNIKALANGERGIDAFERNQDRSVAKQSLMFALSKLPAKWQNNINKKIKGKIFNKFLRGLVNTDTFFEAMDGFESDGFFTKFFYNPVKTANDKLADYTMQFETAYRNAWKERYKTSNDEKAAAEEKHYDELGPNSQPVNKHTLIKMLIYLTTKTSSDKLCSTKPNSTYALHFRGSDLWVEDDLDTTRDNLLKFLSKYLTEEDLKFAQKIVDACGMFWEERAQLDRETMGFRPRKELNYPAVLQIGGEDVKFNGGYFPLIRDRESGSHPFGQDVISVLNSDRPQFGNTLTGALHTNRGASISRDSSVYPLDLRMNSEVGAVMDSIHDICMRKVVANFRWLVNDGEVYNELKTRMGIESFQQFEEYTKSVAQPYGNGGYMSLYEKDAGNFWSAVRRKTVYFMIMGKMSTLLQNFGNIILYGNVVDGWTQADTITSMGTWLKHSEDGKLFADLRNEVTSKSAFMRERMEIPDISLREMKVEESKPNIIAKSTVEWGTKALVMTDNLTALPVWVGAYTKKLNQGATEQEAIDFADSIIRRTLGSSRNIDVAPMMRGGEMVRLFTVFQQFFNTQFNQWYRTYGKTRNAINEGNYSKAASIITSYACAKWLAACMLNLLLVGKNPLGDDDEDGWLNVSQELLTYPLSMLGPVGLFGTTVLQAGLGMRYHGYRLTPAQSSIDQIIKVAKLGGQVASGDKEAGELVEPAVNLFALGIGAPQQLFTWFFNGYDWAMNDMELQAVDFFRRRPKDER